MENIKVSKKISWNLKEIVFSIGVGLFCEEIFLPPSTLHREITMLAEVLF